MDKSEEKESKGSFMLKKPFILQTELIFNEIVKACQGQKNSGFFKKFVNYGRKRFL
jgi:hypothetical protein